MAQPPRQLLYEVPHDIINAIVELVASSPGHSQKQDLKALSLTSPIFLSSARFHLFYHSTFYLAPDDIGGKFKSTLFLLDHFPHIAQFIRSLRIIKPDITHLKAKNLLCTSDEVEHHEMELCRFLHLLNDLQELHIDNLEFCVFPSRELDQATTALKSCLFRNPIQHLGIGNIINFPMDILPHLPLLSLSLRELHSSVYFPFPLPDIEETPRLLLTLRSLHILAFDGQSAVRTWIADKRPFSLSNITSLTIPATNYETGASIALLCSSTLISLTIEGSYGHGETLDLSLFPALRSLTLRLRGLNGSKFRSTPNSSWVEWLTSTVHTVDSSIFRERSLIVRVEEDKVAVQYDPLKPDIDQFDALFDRFPSFTFTLNINNFNDDSDESEIESEYEYDDDAYMSYYELREEDGSEYEESGDEDGYEYEYYAIQNEQPPIEAGAVGDDPEEQNETFGGPSMAEAEFRELATIYPLDDRSDDEDNLVSGNIWI